MAKAVVAIILSSVMIASSKQRRAQLKPVGAAPFEGAILAFACILVASVAAHLLLLVTEECDLESVAAIILVVFDIVQLALAGVSIGYFISPAKMTSLAYGFSIFALIASILGGFA